MIGGERMHRPVGANIIRLKAAAARVALRVRRLSGQSRRGAPINILTPNYFLILDLIFLRLGIFY